MTPANLARDGDGALLHRRIRAGMWLVLVTVAVFAVADLGVAPDRLGPAYAVKALHVLMLVILLAATRGAPGCGVTRLAAFAAVNGSYLLMAAGDVVKGHLATTPLLCVTCNMAAAALLPWGVRLQLATMAVTGLGNLFVLGATGRALPDLVDPAVSVLVAQGVAVYVAYELERFRLERAHVERHLADRAATEALRADVRVALAEGAGRDPQLAACAAAIAAHVDAQAVDIWLDADGAWRLAAHAGSTREETDHAGVAGPAMQGALNAAAGGGRAVVAGPAMQGALTASAGGRSSWFADDLAHERSEIVPPGLRGASGVALAALPLITGARAVGILHVVGTHGLAPAMRDALDAVAAALASGLAHLEAEEATTRLMSELARANQVKSEFVSTMSHELRTPLNVIMGYTDMLSDPEFADPAFALARIRRANHELLELIDATLDLNRLESGRDAPDLEDVRLTDLCAELALEYAPVAERAGVDLVWTAGEPVTLRTDRRKLKIVLKNLVGNALKFTPHGQVRVSAEADGYACTIRVQDTGIGITAEALPRIFEMFEQGDTSDRRSHGGVGLGLHIVRRLCAQLGAAVDVTSEPGRGSCFAVRLPVAGPALHAA